jgi:hypothetical protein
MKIRIDEVGYDKLTGPFGIVEFKDGVSVDDVSRTEINLLSTMVRIVDAETGVPLGMLYDYDAVVDKPAQIIAPLQTKEEADAAALKEAGGKPAAPAKKAELKYAQADLEAIADQKGIAGLREIGDTFGAKGTSIAGLIEAILNAQGTALAGE